MVTYNTTKLFV